MSLSATADLERLQALFSYDVLDTPPEQAFDDIAHLAAQLCAAPVALVSLVGRDRQWFKARVGFAPCETDLDSSVCKFALVEPDLLIIPDLTADDRTFGNPLVTGDPAIRFYAGAPLRDASGFVLGSLCVIDTVPRPDGLTTVEADNLRRLARQVVDALEIRRALKERDAALAEQETSRRERDLLAGAQDAVASAAGKAEGVFAAVVEAALAAIPAADGGAVQVLRGDELVYDATRGTLSDHTDLRVGLHTSLAGWSVRARTSAIVADALSDTRMSKAHVGPLGLRSALCAPIFAAGEPVGVLKLQSYRENAFTHRDQQLAVLFAGVATAGFAAAREAEMTDELRSSEERGRIAALAGGVGISELDLLTNDLRTDDRVKEIFGFAPGEEVSLEQVWSAMQPDDAARIQSELEALLAGDGDHWSFLYRVAAGDGWRHVQAEGSIVRDEVGQPVRLIGANRDVTDQVEAAGRQDVVNQEISHRLKNTLAMVQSIAAQTLRGVADPEALNAFGKRVVALSRAHDVLLRGSWETADLEEVARGVLDAAGADGRFSVEGPSVRLGARATLSTSMLFHELATNAAKYGALSVEDGSVAVAWRIDADELEVTWREIGGPPASPPSRAGFGSRLLKIGLVGTGGSQLNYTTTGFSAIFRAALKRVEAA